MQNKVQFAVCQRPSLSLTGEAGLWSEKSHAASKTQGQSAMQGVRRQSSLPFVDVRQNSASTRSRGCRSLRKPSLLMMSLWVNGCPVTTDQKVRVQRRLLQRGVLVVPSLVPWRTTPRGALRGGRCAHPLCGTPPLRPCPCDEPSRCRAQSPEPPNTAHHPAARAAAAARILLRAAARAPPGR